MYKFQNCYLRNCQLENCHLNSIVKDSVMNNFLFEYFINYLETTLAAWRFEYYWN